MLPPPPPALAYPHTPPYPPAQAPWTAKDMQMARRSEAGDVRAAAHKRARRRAGDCAAPASKRGEGGAGARRAALRLLDSEASALREGGREDGGREEAGLEGSRGVRRSAPRDPLPRTKSATCEPRSRASRAFRPGPSGPGLPARQKNLVKLILTKARPGPLSGSGFQFQNQFLIAIK